MSQHFLFDSSVCDL